MKNGMIILIGIVLSLVLGFQSSLTRSKPKIVFCDVGQGSATYIRFNSSDILIDTGPNGKIVRCLEKYMPYFDRTIELLIITHKQKDHAGGLPSITKSFTIQKKVVSPDNSLLLQMGDASLEVVSPPQQCSLSQNDCSSVIMFSWPQGCALFPSDISGYTLEEIEKTTDVSCPLLLVPHHGSKTGLSSSTTLLADVRVAVISAGKDNSYGHPHKDVLLLLKSHNIDIKRTDIEGDIVMNLEEFPSFLEK